MAGPRRDSRPPIEELGPTLPRVMSGEKYDRVKAERDALHKAAKALRDSGRHLATFCFNVSQSTFRWDESHKELARQLQTQWDAVARPASDLLEGPPVRRTIGHTIRDGVKHPIIINDD